MVRAARNEPGRWGGRDLIPEPSWGDVLLALGPEADAGVGDLSLTLVGCGLGSRGSGGAGCSPPGVCPAAELCTSSGGAGGWAGFPLWCITPEDVSGAGGEVDE